MTVSPVRPTLAVGAAIFDEAGRVVLVQRAKAPLEGRWTLPGGSVELAESLEDATRREALEETGLVVDVGPLVEVYQHISRGPDGAVTFHYVILDYVCRPTGGTLQAGSDARDAAFVTEADFDRYRVNPATQAVIARARRADWAEPGPLVPRLSRIVRDGS